MNKLVLAARWTAVFGVLGLFTFYSLVAFNVIKPANAFADTVSDKKFSHNDKFIAFNDNDNDDRSHGHKTGELCALTQDQLNTLTNQFDVKVSTITVDGKQVSIATIPKTHDVKKRDLYQALGIDHGECRIAKVHHKMFLLYLLPGVS